MEMTEAEIRAMQPGPEMDAAVAAAIGYSDDWISGGTPLRYSTDPGEAFKALIASGFGFQITPACAIVVLTIRPYVDMNFASYSIGDIAQDICIGILLAARAKK